MVTVWFAMLGARFHAASRRGLTGDWLQNALAAGAIEVRSGKASWHGSVSLVPADDVDAVLDAFAAKYHRHGAVIAAWRENPPVFVRADLASALLISVWAANDHRGVIVAASQA